MSLPHSPSEVFQPKPFGNVKIDGLRSQPLFLSVVHGTLSLHHGKAKKASETSPTRHDYRQPKVEEGADAF
jgi:hypothetical protein